jgi:hypothetical protein
MMKKTIITCTTTVLLLTVGTIANAKKPTPPSTVIDYDITEFTCPATESSTEPVELRVMITNVGPSDPGVILQAREEDALLGPTTVVNQIVYDTIEKGKKQKATEYIFYVTPTYQQSYIQWSVTLFDENHVDDSDWAYCNTQIIWN